ncbi:LysR substrate-binding domain-containing protein [Pseudolysinimonas kribbensis]|uniref:LysR substrate-binding domain-containing protein n=1 Tax=Pseudolysinimonas kribbensis TaxID=433641 RepID=UPI0024E0C5F7|nr:LysR substrate-binding domain-containing protein [Pseudolysinimonas kribbensis]
MFDPGLLRTFVAVAETLSFTRAGELLELSQPTVSQQVRKLEVAAGRQLVSRDTRAVALTDNGEAMLGFARSILAAHDEAAAYFTGSAMRGRLRFGSADDLAMTLPPILRDFRQLYPQINLELTVGQSAFLARRLRAGQLDLVFIKEEPDLPDGRLVRRERLVWAAHKALQLDAGSPVPLIAYPAPSISRTAAIAALEAAGRSWRITCNVRETTGTLAAARAGIGVAVLPQNMVPDDLVALADLPMLGEVDFTLLDNPRAAREPIEALVSAIVGRGVRAPA